MMMMMMMVMMMMMMMVMVVMMMMKFSIFRSACENILKHFTMLLCTNISIFN